MSIDVMFEHILRNVGGMHMPFSDNLYRLRKKANLSQENVSEALHVTRQAVSKWESGQSLPDVETCIKLCEILQVSPNRLLLGENDNLGSDPKNERITEKTGYTITSVFLMVTLLCGTILLVYNLYNGSYFEPVVHVLAFSMICGSLISFLGISVNRLVRNRDTKEK